MIAYAAGIKWACSPYRRATYRYTPILALLLAPNGFIHPSFGKYLFAACDILAGIIMHNLLSKLILPRVGTDESGDRKASAAAGGDASGPTQWSDKATLLTTIHLFNPMVFVISTRGSSESVLSLFVLCTLYFSLKDRWDLAAVFLGLSTHWKIYPLIYGVSSLSIIASGIPGTSARLLQCAPSKKAPQSVKDSLCDVRRLINARTARYTALSAGTFAILGVAMYAVCVCYFKALRGFSSLEA